jgi:ABC-type multidrug transport system fused ATPase/permease subunit
MTSVAEKLQKKSGRRPAAKQVRLKLVYIDFWSALKLSFFGALALGIITVVAAAVIWIVINSTSLFTDLDQILGEIFNDPTFSISKDFSFGTVMTFTTVMAVVNTIIFTVLGAIAAIVYNFMVKITGGLHVGFTNS